MLGVQDGATSANVVQGICDMKRNRFHISMVRTSAVRMFCSLVQGDAAGLEQRGHGGVRHWQWCLASAEDQKAFSSILLKQPELADTQRIAEEELQRLRRKLLGTLRKQMTAPAPPECPQQPQNQIRLPVDLMQERVDTLMSLQQLEERYELLSRGLVIAESSALVAMKRQQRARRGVRSSSRIPSILALHKSAQFPAVFLVVH